MSARWRPTLRYLMQTEAHVYALAIAASVLLSFYPFLIVMLSFCRNVLHWPAAVEAVYVALNDYLARRSGRFRAPQHIRRAARCKSPRCSSCSSPPMASSNLSKWRSTGPGEWRPTAAT